METEERVQPKKQVTMVFYGIAPPPPVLSDKFKSFSLLEAVTTPVPLARNREVDDHTARSRMNTRRPATTNGPGSGVMNWSSRSGSQRESLPLQGFVPGCGVSPPFSRSSLRPLAKCLPHVCLCAAALVKSALPRREAACGRRSQMLALTCHDGSPLGHLTGFEPRNITPPSVPLWF